MKKRNAIWQIALPYEKEVAMISRLSYFILVLVLASLLIGCSGGGTAVNSTTTDNSAAADYCTQNGGAVETRYPFYDTNSDNPLPLAGSLAVCTFTADDRSRITVSLDTLYTDQPTLAALAYRAKTLLEPGPPSANPSSIYCTQLGGTDSFGGINAAGGGWGLADAADAISLCIFPDLSIIDSWGLTYHSDGTIRGADLTDLLRYKE
jgi:putative hemolysin